MSAIGRAAPAVAALLFAAGCASTRPVSRPAPSVEVTWDARRVEECSLLGYVRAKDGYAVPPAADLRDSDDKICRWRARRLGGDVVLRVTLPQQVMEFPDRPILLAAPIEGSTTIGVVYRCRAPRL